MKELSGGRALVTGAGGFIGSHLAERLVEIGAETRAFVHYNSAGSRGWLDHSQLAGEMEVIAGDVSDAETVTEAMQGVDVVFHLAALIGIPYSYKATASYVRTNIEGTVNVLQAARALDTERIVHTSTSEVYGTARTVPITEEHPLVAQSPYSASKIGADMMATAFGRSFDLRVSIARPFNTYGPRQSARAVVPTIVSQCLANQGRIVLGNLSPTRDLVFVSDTVEGFIAVAASDACVGETVNLGTGEETSIGGLVELVGELTGITPVVSEDSGRVRAPDTEVERLRSDSRKVQRLAGWSRKTPLREGLKDTIEWMAENIERYRPDAYAI